MPPSFYQNHGPVYCPSKVDGSTLKDKCVVITGGSSGLGLSYARAFADVGAYVVIADIKPPADDKVKEKCLFVPCDVSVWEEQVNVFKKAIEGAPKKGIDIVIANAGIYGPDILVGLDDEEPQKPVTKLLDINLLGVLYTSKLAGYYFNKQSRDDFDRCLILVSSIMAYVDTQGSAVYQAAKHGVRGIMCCLRRKGLMRVNALAPWYVATPILPEAFIETTGKQFREKGIDFATLDDAVTAAMRIATDSSLNGRTLTIVPRQLSPSGYMDTGLDDFVEGSPCDIMQRVTNSLEYGKFGS